MAKEEHAHLYLGRSGQFAVMSELLYRRRNTAIPEVDVGDDVFVVRDKDDIVTRVQVKSANAAAQHGGENEGQPRQTDAAMAERTTLHLGRLRRHARAEIDRYISVRGPA